MSLKLNTTILGNLLPRPVIVQALRRPSVIGETQKAAPVSPVYMYKRLGLVPSHGSCLAGVLEVWVIIGAIAAPQ
jgi:hypothetical protein